MGGALGLYADEAHLFEVFRPQKAVNCSRALFFCGVMVFDLSHCCFVVTDGVFSVAADVAFCCCRCYVLLLQMLLQSLMLRFVGADFAFRVVAEFKFCCCRCCVS